MERYNRQLMLPEIGHNGQRKLQEAKVLLVGVGGLGSPIALYLAGAGIGTLGLVDNDVVSLSNLQRQILYTGNEVGLPKALQAKQRLEALNSEVCIHAHPYRLTTDNAERLIGDYDIVVDGCDNFATRYLIDKVCAQMGKPYVHGAIQAFSGQVSVFHTPGCHTSYSMLFPEEEIGQLPLQVSNELSKTTDAKRHEVASPLPLPQGVMGITPGIVGCVQAAEVIKIICKFGEILADKLWTIDLKTMQSEIILL